MHQRRFTRVLLAFGFVAAGSAVATLASGAAQAGPPTPTGSADRFDQAPSSGAIDPVILPAALDDDRRVTVIVEMAAEPVAVVEAQQGRKLSAAEKKAVRDRLRADQAAAAAEIASEGGQVGATMQSAYNGIRVSIARNAIPALAEIDGVVAVHSVPTYTIDNAQSIPYLGVEQVWQNNGYTGDGIKVAIIDTGIDYTHANFGGPGTVEAFQAADATDTAPADPALFGPDAPRIKGGWDFVGDDYDASADDGDPALIPQPDPNPLDCNGHGSHVAGSTGGGGVNPDGTAYTGPYDASTPSNEFLIGPGVAPEVDLYALRVFGCGGSTDVTVEAIDWAVDNEMDVINMSLGSPFGRADDPSAVASENAVAAGVVVVTSAGNSGPNPYITGSPGTGNGVVSTAAVDPSPTFPGAALTLESGQVITAINANGAELPAGPYEVVVLNSLGCEAAEYTAAGIDPDPNAPLQIAVTERGTCARVSRAICGQATGADAVIMINNANSLPPYEGPITSNPDPTTSSCETDYPVTIPFLGVTSSDGPALRAVDGQQMTIAAADIANPGYRQFASFSSGGPRTGDSAVKPSVAAPGVAIYSTDVGTGSGGAYISGTSMASPMVAGVAALSVQAHPGWAAADVAATLVNTADPGGVDGYTLTRGGAGLVDPTDAVGASVIAYGDTASVNGTSFGMPTLSFGFAESATTFAGTKTVTLVNHGGTDATYNTSFAAAPGSLGAAVSVTPTSVTVPAGGQATVDVTVSIDAAAVPDSINPPGQHKFHQVSGNVLFDGDGVDLSVPYLLVPRSLSDLDATAGLFKPNAKGTRITLSNEDGAIASALDFYTWGLSDPDDIDEASDGSSGFDVRAVGVQSFPFNADGSNQLLVFAVNNWSRFSNAATAEYDILIDVDGDGNDDFAVFAVDSGAVRAGSFNGLMEVFFADLNNGGLFTSGFLAASPTDSSTLLLPVETADLGITGAFSYSAVSFSLASDGVDVVNGVAGYNPWVKAYPGWDGVWVDLAPGETVTDTVFVNAPAYGYGKPLGLMAVAYDNAAGADEAILLRSRN